MAMFRVQILETTVHVIDVEADDSESAADLAMEQFGAIDYTEDATNTESMAELVTNLETGDRSFRA